MPATTSVTPTGNAYIDGVLDGTKWAVSNLTFSFPTSGSYYGSGYGDGEPTHGFQALNATQQAVVYDVLAQYSSVANITFLNGQGNFAAITETSSQHADLRYAESTLPSTAWAYYPSTYPEGGDAWFNRVDFNTPVIGNYAYTAFLHETGHALGLKHPHDISGSFGAMPLDKDSMEYSVMSYRSYIGQSLEGYTNETWGYAQSLMMFDIAGVQAMYGATFNSNAGDTTYSWSSTTGEMFIDGVGQGAPGGNRIFRTIWDGNGNDTYDFSNYATNLVVSLAPGGWTTTSSAQLALLNQYHVVVDGAQPIYAVGNIANALLYNGDLRSLIENANGGSGNDAITGNIAANVLNGNSGNDTLTGDAGDDTLVGGTGKDSIYGGDGNDTLQVVTGDVVAGEIYDGGNNIDTLKVTGAADFSTSTVTSIEALRLGSSATFGSNQLQSSGGLAAALAVTGTSGNTDIVDIIVKPTALSVNLSAWTFVAGLWTPGADNDRVVIDGSALTNGQNAQIVGTSQWDTVNGGNGNDTLTGGPGNDVLNGGEGTDTAVFSGNLADYLVTDNGNGTYTVADLRASSPDGTDTISSVEKLVFADVPGGIAPAAAAPPIGTLPPVFGNFDASRTISEAVFHLNGAVVLDTNVAISNPEATGFNDGEVTVSIAGATADDRFGITAAGGITMENGVVAVGNHVLYNGVAFGTISSDGQGGGALTIGLNASGVTNVQVQPLLRAITFQNTSQDPPAGARTITVAVTDTEGDVGTAPMALTITPTAPPVFGDFDAARTISEAVFHTGSVVLDTNVTISNPEATGFNNGSVIVSIASATADDRFGIAAAGGITVTGGVAVGNHVLYNGVAFGIISSDGQGGGALTITLNASGVTNAQVQPLLRAITFENTSDSPPDTARTITVAVTDTEGDVGSAPMALTITPTYPPVFGNFDTARTISESVLNAGAVRLDTNVTISNPEATGFNNGSVTVSIASATLDDQFGITAVGGISVENGVVAVGNHVLYNGVVFGIISSDGHGGTALTIALNASGVTNAQVQPLLRAITFQNTSDNPSPDPRDITVAVTDTEGDIGSAHMALTINLDAAQTVMTGAAGAAASQPTLLDDRTLTSHDPDNMPSALVTEAAVQPVAVQLPSDSLVFDAFASNASLPTDVSELFQFPDARHHEHVRHHETASGPVSIEILTKSLDAAFHHTDWFTHHQHHADDWLV